jgi:phage/plasmid-associated DNA primase
MTELSDNKNKKIMNEYEIYSIDNYALATEQFIKNNKIIFTNKKKLNEALLIDKKYHFRIHNNKTYIFFGDLDKYKNDINTFKKILKDFMKTNYGLTFNDNEFKYTKNNMKEGSYHYSIPKWNASTKKLKEIHQLLLKMHKSDFSYEDNKKMISCIDTTNYSEHWFRCPNQSKGDISGVNNQHIIIEGKMDDFILNYIPKNSINIDNINNINDNINENKKVKKQKENLNIIKKHDTEQDNTDKNNMVIYKNNINKTKYSGNEIVLSSALTETKLYEKVFDECYKQERFDTYDTWISVGMALRNIFPNEHDAFNLFNYFSSKGSNYEGIEKTKYKFTTFIKKNDSNGYTVATIYYYAIEDNKPKFIEIMNKNTFELGTTDICKYLKIMAGYKFIYKINGDKYKLYCFNDKYWENDDILLRKYLSDDLYEFLKMVLIQVYWNAKDFNSLKNKIEKLKILSFKKELVETYKEYGVNNEITFDDKWWLFGFNNMVYDMKEECFREYKFDDYVSITCGYDWREPTKEEIETVNSLINKIMPIKEERDFYLQLLCTGIDGRCLEKFIVFNGDGGNGKGMLDDLMLLMLGNYGLIGNNGLLFEISKSGSNPEKANLHKKRFVVFREPPEKKKFENSVIKELTGGGEFSARGLYESDAKKELNLTMIVECNKKPLFAEEPTNAEVRRIIDIYFRSTFVTDITLINETKYIYQANAKYKTKEFQNKHKYALFKILIEEHKKYYKHNNNALTPPKSIVDRTQLYLEMSCNLVQWFKDNYEETYNNKDICKIKDLYDEFYKSTFFYNLSKTEQKKYNKTYFTEYMKENIFFRKYYVDRYNNYRTVLRGWKKKNIDDSDIDEDINDI